MVFVPLNTKKMRFERINIEISNICNLKCPFCPIVERDKQVMIPARFSQVVQEVAPYTKEVVLHLLGEPLGHPEFPQILTAAGDAGVPVNIVTNGLLVVGDRVQELLRPMVRQVSFSLHSFEANFPGQDPATYLKRVKAFIDRALVERPDLYLNLRLWDISGVTKDESIHNQRMRAQLAELFEFAWADVAVDLRRRKSWRIRGRLYLHFDSRFEWPETGGMIRQEFGTCHALKGHIGIHADGTVVPCCLDHKGDIPLGNIFTSSISDILSGPRATAMREGFRRGILVEDLCKTCGFIERFKAKPQKNKSSFKVRNGNSQKADFSSSSLSLLQQ